MFPFIPSICVRNARDYKRILFMESIWDVLIDIYYINYATNVLWYTKMAVQALVPQISDVNAISLRGLACI